jgi:hypothetical protein
MTWQEEGVAAPLFAAADVRDLPLDDATWRRCARGEADDNDAASDSGCDAAADDGDESDAPPRLFDAVLDQSTLDALPAHRGGRALLHGALASLAASLAPRGIAALISQRPPEVAVPLLTTHPALTWRLLSAAPVHAAVGPAFCYLLQRADASRGATADEALAAAWGCAEPASPPARCSLAVCGKACAAQRWFECASCVAEAVCAACAAACHAGHALEAAPGAPERGFCDCGFSGRCAACGVAPLNDGEDEEPMPLP